MKPNEIVELVEKLNYELYDKAHNLVVEGGLCFVYKSVGYSDYVAVLDFCLWSSENDTRDYDEETDEYEDLEVCLRREFNKLVEVLAQVKL